MKKMKWLWRSDESTGTNKKKTRIVYLEILRIVAIWGVMYCHSGSRGIDYYLQAGNAAEYWFGFFAAVTAQYCVPLFFMISGAVLLDREESLEYVLKKRVLKMAVLILLVNLLQIFWNHRIDLLEWFDWKKYLRAVYEVGASTTHWFLYTYISFLLILPFLQRLVRNIPEERWFLYLLLLETVGGLLPVAEYRFGMAPGGLQLHQFPFYVMCGIQGYFVACRSGEIFYKKKNILILFIVTMLILGVNAHMVYIQSEVYMQYFTLNYAFLIFAVVRYICHIWRMPSGLERFFCFAGAGVFGVYLMEGQLRELLQPVYTLLSAWMPAYPAVFLWHLICLSVGILAAHLIKKIPFIGRLI